MRLVSIIINIMFHGPDGTHSKSLKYVPALCGTCDGQLVSLASGTCKPQFPIDSLSLKLSKRLNLNLKCASADVNVTVETLNYTRYCVIILLTANSHDYYSKLKKRLMRRRASLAVCTFEISSPGPFDNLKS